MWLSVCLWLQQPGFDSWLGQVEYFRSMTMAANVELGLVKIANREDTDQTASSEAV